VTPDPAFARTSLSHRKGGACRRNVASAQLAVRDLVALDGVRFSVEGAHVLDEAARDRGAAVLSA
jgi:hypothetical protein